MKFCSAVREVTKMIAKSVSLRVKQGLAVVIMAIAMLPATLWAGTLKDNFSGNMSRWDLVNAPSGSWELKNGELIITPHNYPVGFFIGETTWKDYTIGVSAKIVKSQPSGSIEGAVIGVRATSLIDGYVFGFGTLGDGNKYVFCFRADGNIVVTIAVFKPFEWELDRWYDLKLDAEGNTFKFYVNNELFIEYTDKVYSAGKMNISASFSTTTAHFDDFSVTGNDIPDTLASVSQKGKIAIAWGKLKGK